MKGDKMKKKLYILGTAALIVLIASSGCATSGGYQVVSDENELPSILQRLSPQLSKLKTGMSLEDFSEIFPEAYVGGQYKQITAYELTDTQQYVTQADIDYINEWEGFGSPNPRTKKETLWFYFYDDKLVKWGRPQDWPEQ